ncbi:MAG: hypothetical protein WD342_19160 [Verrucomicrobiales bacterium]
MKLDALQYWRDTRGLGPARQMALDQALFEHSASTGSATARFYGWAEAALTVGYFHRFASGDRGALRDRPVRRFTGGGLVEHGEDLTFAVNFPAGSGPAIIKSEDRYQWVHRHLVGALKATGFETVLKKTAVPQESGPCFANPVAWDILDATNGAKIGGGAQRRSGGAVIHQGSVRLPRELRDPEAEWTAGFLGRLSRRVDALGESEKEKIEESAVRLDRERYSSPDWNRWP